MKSTLRVRKQFILDPAKIRIVRTLTKSKTDTEAINRALDEVIANSRIEKALLSVKSQGKITDIYGRLAG